MVCPELGWSKIVEKSRQLFKNLMKKNYVYNDKYYGDIQLFCPKIWTNLAHGRPR